MVVQNIPKSMIAVCGTGGVGTTTIALNLALSLHKQQGKVLLVDADWELGNLSTFLDLPRQQLLSYPEISEQLPPHFGLHEHESGMVVLPTRFTFETKGMSSHLFSALLPLFKRHFDLVIFDMGRQIGDYAWLAWERSDLTMIVGELTLQSLYRTRMMIDAYTHIREDKLTDNLMIVANQSHPEPLARKSMNAERASEFLKQAISMQIDYIPNEPQHAINTATPLIELDMRFDHAMNQLRDLMLARLGG